MSKIDHLGIAVKSIAAARGFYESLGLRVVQEETVEHEKVRVAMIPVDESRIELLEPLSDDSPIAKFLAKRGASTIVARGRSLKQSQAAMFASI